MCGGYGSAVQKKAEAIETLFGQQTHVALMNHVLDGNACMHHLANTLDHLCSTVMRYYATITVETCSYFLSNISKNYQNLLINSKVTASKRYLIY